MRILRIAVLCSFAVIAGCSSSDASNVMNVDENLTTTDLNEPLTADSPAPSTPAPLHQYAIKDGDRYGYVAAVSEDDQKRGKVAGDVVFFVYRGRDGEIFKIDQVTPTGDVIESDECEQPCQAIKRYRYGQVSYLGFEPDSLIGAAYTDAFNGFLTPAARLKPVNTSNIPVYSTENTTSSLSNSFPQTQENASNEAAQPAGNEE